jgi:hypothetical protein
MKSFFLQNKKILHVLGVIPLAIEFLSFGLGFV